VKAGDDIFDDSDMPPIGNPHRALDKIRETPPLPDPGIGTPAPDDAAGKHIWRLLALHADLKEQLKEPLKLSEIDIETMKLNDLDHEAKFVIISEINKILNIKRTKNPEWSGRPRSIIIRKNNEGPSFP
jgi:hypothetical protein